MPDLGDTATATLVVDPFDGTTDAALQVLKPDGTDSTTPAPTTADLGKTWTRPVTYDQPFWWTLAWTVTGTGAGVRAQHVYVEPAPLVPPALPVYTTLERLKRARRIPVGNTEHDEDLQETIRTASRAIDLKCGNRQFWLDGEASARLFYTTGPRLIHVEGRRAWDRDEVLLIDDLGSTGALSVEVSDDGATWTTVPATEYRAEPLNALSRRWPVTQLRALPPRRWSSSWMVRVTERWGWPALPEQVATAATILSNRLALRPDSPEGVAGSTEWGVLRLSRWDPDVETLLGPFILPELDD